MKEDTPSHTATGRMATEAALPRAETLVGFSPRGDRWLLALAFVALIAEVTLLLHQLKVISLPFAVATQGGSGETVGRVLERVRSVQSRAQGSLTWYPVAQGDRVRLHDTLMTGPASGARVFLEGAGELVLGPDTLIRFSDERSWGFSPALSLTVNQGVVRVRSRERAVRLETAEKQVAVEPGSEVEIRRQPLETRSELEVKVGEVRVAVAPGEAVQRVEAGEILRLDDVAGEVETIFLIEAPLPVTGSRYFSQGGAAAVAFQWKDAQPGDVVEWDGSPDFSSFDRRPASESRQVTLKPGKYYWRVRRGDVVSQSLSFLVVPELEYRVESPRPRDSLSRRRPVELEWDAEGEAESFRVQLSDSETFERVLLETETRESRWKVGTLAPGQYFWRVQARSEKWGEWPFSPLYSFSVRKPLEAPVPTGVKLLPRKGKEKKGDRGSWYAPPQWVRRLAAGLAEWIVPSAHAEAPRLRMEFFWQSIERAVSYRLEIAADREFRHLLKREEVTGTSAIVALPRRVRYFWRVAGRDEDGELGRFSEPQEVRPPPPRPKSPVVAEAPPKVPETPAAPPPPPARARGWQWFTPSWLRVGLSGAVTRESFRHAAYEATGQGAPLGRGLLYWHRTVTDWEWELGLWYEKLRYAPREPYDAYLNETVLYQFGARSLWKGLLSYRGVPLTWGLGFEKIHFLTPSLTGVTVTSGTPVYFLAGVSEARMWGSEWFWQNDLLLEIAPVGQVKGAGLLLRSRIGGWRLGGFSAELQATFRPRYQYVAPIRQALTRWEFGVALVLGQVFDVSPLWKAAPAMEAPSAPARTAPPKASP